MKRDQSRGFGSELLLVGVLLVVLGLGGCRGLTTRMPLPGTTLYPEDYRQSSREFLSVFRLAFEEENRAELTRMIAPRYAGYSNGRKTLVDRINQVFNQFDVLTLEMTVEQVTPFRGSITARTEWELRWRCTSSNPDRGCPELKNAEEYDPRKRSGATTFKLIWRNGGWTIRDQRGSVLLGLFEPGNAVSR